MDTGPIPASSSKTSNRHRLNRGGDRQANHALWRIVITRMGAQPPTRAYVAWRGKIDGQTLPDAARIIVRVLGCRRSRGLADFAGLDLA
jgi:transposase